jgi:hypothetical protein
MVEKPQYSSKYTPERIKELVNRISALRLRWLASVNDRVSNTSPKAQPSERLEKSPSER